MKSVFKVASKIQRKLSAEPERKRRRVVQMPDPHDAKPEPEAPKAPEAPEAPEKEEDRYGTPSYWAAAEEQVSSGGYKAESLEKEKFTFNVDQEIKRQARMANLEPVPDVVNVTLDDVDTGPWILTHGSYRQPADGEIESIPNIPDNVRYEHMGAYITMVLDKADLSPILVVSEKDNKEVLFVPRKGDRSEEFKLTYRKTPRNMIGLNMRSSDLTSVANSSRMRIISLAEKFRSKLADDESPDTVRQEAPWGMENETPQTELSPQSPALADEKLSSSEISFLIRSLEFSQDENPSLQAWEESKPEEAGAFLSGLRGKLEGLLSDS